MGREYRFEFKRLDVYQVAVEHFRWTCDVVRRLPRGPFKVTDQAVGSSLSVMGNIGEANGRDRKHNAAEERLARIGMMLTRLIQLQRRRRAPTRPKIEDRPSNIEDRTSKIESRKGGEA